MLWKIRAGDSQHWLCTADFPKFTEEQLRDRNRDSMFGTMLLSDHTNNNLSKEQDRRMKQMQDPHSVMQQRLNDMNPMMFGDTIRLPVFNTKQNFNLTAQASASATPEPAK